MYSMDFFLSVCMRVCGYEIFARHQFVRLEKKKRLHPNFERWHSVGVERGLFGVYIIYYTFETENRPLKSNSTLVHMLPI